ncbi:MAG: hypothetical protein V4671_15530 [Armatimonadota bacterium]
MANDTPISITLYELFARKKEFVGKKVLITAFFVVSKYVEESSAIYPTHIDYKYGLDTKVNFMLDRSLRIDDKFVREKNKKYCYIEGIVSLYKADWGLFDFTLDKVTRVDVKSSLRREDRV